MSTVIDVHGLTRRFGDLTAADHVQFEVSTHLLCFSEEA